MTPPVQQRSSFVNDGYGGGTGMGVKDLTQPVGGINGGMGGAAITRPPPGQITQGPGNIAGRYSPGGNFHRMTAPPPGVTARTMVTGPGGVQGQWSPGGNFHAMPQQPMTRTPVVPQGAPQYDPSRVTPEMQAAQQMGGGMGGGINPQQIQQWMASPQAQQIIQMLMQGGQQGGNIPASYGRFNPAGQGTSWDY